MAIALLVGFIPHTQAALVWFVVDPARDYSWYLREFRKEAMQELRKLQSISMEELRNSITEKFIISSDGNEATKIAKITQSVSETANARSEESYKPISICGAFENAGAFIDAYEEAITCQPERMKSKIDNLNAVINNENIGNDLVITLTNGASSETEKSEAFLQGLADMQGALGSAVNQDKLLDEEEYEKARLALDVIFNTSDVQPNVENGMADVDSIARLINNQLLRNQFESRLNDTTANNDNNSSGNGLARLQIRTGSPEHVQEHLAKIRDAEMTPEVWRLITLQHAQNLIVEMENFKRNIDKARNTALTYKSK